MAFGRKRVSQTSLDDWNVSLCLKNSQREGKKKITPPEEIPKKLGETLTSAMTHSERSFFFVTLKDNICETSL